MKGRSHENRKRVIARIWRFIRTPKEKGKEPYCRYSDVRLLHWHGAEFTIFYGNLTKETTATGNRAVLSFSK